MRILAAVSRELAQYSQAEKLIETAFGDAVLKSLDFTAFGAQADNGIVPAGLLSGATQVTASTATDMASAMATDLGALAAAIAAYNIDVSDVVYVAAPRQAVELKARLSPKFDNAILSTLALADKTVACFAPKALASAYESPLQIDSSTQSAIVFESVSPGTPTTDAPTMSAWQQELIVLRIKARCAWTLRQGGASLVQK
jgi:hypothetical protein